MRLTAPSTWTWWFWAGLAVLLGYKAGAAHRAYRYYHALWDYCEPDRRFEGEPGISCAGGLRFYIVFVTAAWILGAAAFALPMLIAYMHTSKRRDVANPS